MIAMPQTRARRLAAALAGIALTIAWPLTGAFAAGQRTAPLPRERVDPHGGPADAGSPEAEAADTAPAEGTAEFADLVLDRYGSRKGWGTEFVRDGKGNPEALRLFLPSPLNDGPASGKAKPPGAIGTILPLRPQEYLNRFRQVEFRKGVAETVPFRFVEIGWNTEGQPGKRRSGVTGPHFDIHFNISGMVPPNEDGACSADQKACNASKAESARRLARRPARCFLPRGSIAVADRPPNVAGLYNLASAPERSDPSAGEQPAVIYGTFDGEIVFLGVSLSVAVLERAAAEADAGERLSWPIRQPRVYRHAWWPRTVALEYRPDQRVFGVSLEDFSKRKVSKTCG